MATDSSIELDSRLLTAGAILVGVGGTLWFAGMVVGGSAVLGAARQWLDQLDQPVSETARQKWQQLMGAAAAGSEAWRQGPPSKATTA